MKSFAFAMLTVVGLAWWAFAEDEIRCTREGPICLNCTSIGYCKKTGDFSFEVTEVEDCVVNFVCDEWTLQCERNGICRYAPFSCPDTTVDLVPDPYSCTGYYSCSEAYPYKCGDGMVFRDNTCRPYDNDESCNDYPVLCEVANQTISIQGFNYTCLEETINDIHTIHPVLEA